MTPESDKRLREAYPLVFQGPLLNDEPIRCGEGWLYIIEALCKQLQRLIAKAPEDERPLYRAVSIKEKFGTLRFYLESAPSDFMHPINREIAGAEWCSGIFCDVCGKPGKLRTLTDKAPIVATRCDEHQTVMRRP